MLVKMVALCSFVRRLLFGCIFPITGWGGLWGREMQAVGCGEERCKGRHWSSCQRGSGLSVMVVEDN